MEPEYWTLHKWLFEAYHAGLKTADIGCMPHAVAMTWFIGPNWREEQEKIVLDYIEKNPEEALFLAQVFGGLPEP